MPVPLSLIPILALAAICAGAASLVRRELREQRRPRASRLAWLVVPAVALGAAAAWCGLDLYVGGPGELVALDVAALACAGVTLWREELLRAIDGALGTSGAHAGSKHPRRLALTCVILLACALLGFLALELPYNTDLLAMAPNFVALEVALVTGILLFLLLLFQSRGAGLTLGVALLWVAGLAQFFVFSFKGTAILPSDLLALDTAATVSAAYEYSVNGAVALGLACVLLAGALSQLQRPLEPSPERGRGLVAGARLAGAALVLAVLVGAVAVPSYSSLGVVPNYWNMIGSYRRYGILPSFVAVFRDMPIKVPEGYTDDAARELEDAYVAEYDSTRGSTPEREAAEEQFAEVQPSVICIMNESFADLSSYEGETWGYAGTEFLRNISTALMCGDTDVSVMGAGTCNSEFEFLTGVSVPFVGDGKYPYLLYDLTECPSLARQFSEFGYETTAIHPQTPTNWNRDVAYAQLGFDTFLDWTDLPDSPILHHGVMDGVTYSRIIEILLETDEPQFIFDVTMQNHGGYNIGNTPPELLRTFEVDGLDDSENAQLSEYISCVSYSDHDLMGFLEQLRSINRPVIVVFFGDHQPSVAPMLNDAIYPDEDPDSLEHVSREYSTPYFVWANYDVAGNDQLSEAKNTCLSYLSAQMVEAVGAPLTDFQKTKLVAEQGMPSLCSIGARTADGTLVSLDEGESLPQEYDDLSRITYLEFASKL